MLTEVLGEVHAVPEAQAGGRGGRQRLADEPGRSAPGAQHAGLKEGKVAWEQEGGRPADLMEPVPQPAASDPAGRRALGRLGWGVACEALGRLPASDPPASVPSVWSTGGCA